ncbi:ion channel protein Tsx [Ferrimonas marina]|uniref:Nucleoside-specific outer membrane channel protein Tsx n=1 Tax=Ferrimonas marina TaxID=299255 RepID=A0A1M5RMK0_9GAMM|nr:ion channel protein Tsx [Ferrimonas marina]SHH27400.1 Nucleoside-specific outer membrane channel protein Tsx [Ferrimonas marina]
MHKTGIALAALMMAPAAVAEEWVQWWDASVTGLYGENYEVDPQRQSTVTLEFAGGWKYGDWFVFQDFIWFGGGGDTNYGEISPRFSFSKISGRNVAVGPLTDLSLALTLEQGKDAGESLLYGLGSDWQIPGFRYFQANVYRRDALGGDFNFSDGWQLTGVYRIDWALGQSQVVLDGFFDWVFASDDGRYQENFHFNPQLKYDLGAIVLNKPDRLFVGIEYDYWSDKYGINGADQDTFSWLVKYHF